MPTHPPAGEYARETAGEYARRLGDGFFYNRSGLGVSLPRPTTRSMLYSQSPDATPVSGLLSRGSYPLLLSLHLRFNRIVTL